MRRRHLDAGPALDRAPTTPEDLRTGLDARGRILEAGISMFADKGYVATSVREIVLAAGVTKPVLYYYFGSKEGLFRDIVQGAVQRQVEIIEAMRRSEGTFPERLCNLFAAVMKDAQENRALLGMIHGIIFGPKQGKPDYDFGVFHQRLALAVKALYVEGVDQGEAGAADPEVVVQIILALINHAIHLDFAFNGQTRPSLPLEMLRLALRGLIQGDDKK
ncbi:MAG: TetR/AcrR family transcriptional regulator [Pseudomonadota bacterium]